MKNFRSFFWLRLVAIIVIVFLIWNAKRPSVETNPAASFITNETNAAPQALSTPIRSGPESIQTNIPQMAISTNQVKASADKDKVALIKQFLGANDADIVFYGKLEDQFSNVVGNAIVNFGVRYENLSGTGVKRGQVVADVNGLFTISGYKGQDVSVVPEKAGYVPLKMLGSGNYSPALYSEEQRAHPDPNNPVVITMWKLQGAEPLAGISKRYKINYTSAPIHFDLLAREIVPAGGDLIITVNRPSGEISGRNPQAWNITVEIPNGGFIETSQGEAQMTFAAPENGYRQSGVFSKNNGPDLVDKMIFIQSRNSQIYSKVHLLFGINRTPEGFMDVEFAGVANTNGSRNWEATVPQ